MFVGLHDSKVILTVQCVLIISLLSMHQYGKQHLGTRSNIQFKLSVNGAYPILCGLAYPILGGLAYTILGGLAYPIHGGLAYPILGGLYTLCNKYTLYISIILQIWPKNNKHEWGIKYAIYLTSLPYQLHTYLYPTLPAIHILVPYLTSYIPDTCTLPYQLYT